MTDEGEGGGVGPDSPGAQIWSSFWSPCLYLSVLSHSLPARWYIICQRYNQHCAQMSERSSDTWIVRMLVLSRPHVEWWLGWGGVGPFQPVTVDTPAFQRKSPFYSRATFCWNTFRVVPSPLYHRQPAIDMRLVPKNWTWCLRTEGLSTWTLQHHLDCQFLGQGRTATE